jgi:hypothetical protein
MARRVRPRFRGPAADSALGEALLDAISIVAAVGFAADVSQCLQLCGETFRAGDRGATNDMLAQSLRLQCGAREAHAAGREEIAVPMLWGELETFEGTSQLIRAAILNNLPRVLQLIQLGAPLEIDDEACGWTALIWACHEGNELVAKALLDGKYAGRGATIDKRDACGSTPIMHASNNCHEAVVRLLLSRGAKQELQSDDGDTALHMAVYGNSSVVVALLCAAPGAAAALSIRGTNRTPLAWAIALGRAECEAVLRAHGAPE